MAPWSPEIEENLSLLIKEWLKQNGGSQADLRESLQAESSRMPALLEVLKKEYALGGISKVAERLCNIEKNWKLTEPNHPINTSKNEDNPFDQLDLVLGEMREGLKD